YDVVRDRDREQLATGTPYEEVCIIASVTADSLTGRTTFPGYRMIELFYPTVPYFGPNVFRRFNRTTLSLELRKGTIDELVMGLSHLESLKVSDTGLGSFEVLPEANPILQALAIHERKLVTLSANVRFLVGLQLLDLSGCSLTTVDLGTLTPIPWLTVLNLADNRLTLVEATEDVVLPELIMFDVQQNDLQRISRYPEMFPGLRFTRLLQNGWRCEWVSEVRNKIWTRRITVLGSDFECAGEARVNNGGLCCVPTEERIAISKTMLSVLAELGRSAVGGDGSPRRATDSATVADAPPMTVKVFENETVEGVIGVEMDNVGIYLQEPVRAI
ncbi:uncharacterized protein LOC128277167, partial [Anopheles cruzii]|uniref:uncharacterized protein LOC128277166 n=1 Tax=Anopheles cruzii TaxID=68878 RepID=UPI0022EC6450